MSSPNLYLAAAGLALGVAIGGGSVALSTDDAPAQERVLSEAQSTLLASCPEIADAPGECSYGCKTHLGDAAEETEGWCCGGAYMPQRTQECLSKAVGW